MFNSILCVCTGNICRSPLAEAYLKHCLPQKRVASAGIAALEGCGIESVASGIAEREKLNVSEHIARQIDAELVSAHELILVMERGQRDWICERFPHARGRVFLVSKWDDDEDVTDPFRRSAEFFDAVYARLQSCLDDWVKKLS